MNESDRASEVTGAGSNQRPESLAAPAPRRVWFAVRGAPIQGRFSMAVSLISPPTMR